MIDLFIDEEDEVLEVSDSLGDEILDVRASDPVDNTVPSGRSAAAEAVLLLAELGAETERADETLTAGRLLDLRDGLLGAYRAIAERAPRGCGHGLWQAERALAPVRVAGRDEELRGSAARNPAVTLIVETTGVPGPDGATIEVPDGTAIVCRGTQCSLPVRTVDELEQLLAQ